MRKGFQRYAEFHGKRSKKVFEKTLHTPKELIQLGRIHAVEYECTKLNGGGDGKKAIYRHVFENPAYLYEDEQGCKQLYILGERIEVTNAGIEG
jgi:predicted ABC-type transport system involved in lysophospholipase L1 biosynthesis ATPase subunit